MKLLRQILSIHGVPVVGLPRVTVMLEKHSSIKLRSSNICNFK